MCRTLTAAGDYALALDTYVTALESLPSVAPSTERIVSEVLRLGYALTDFVIDGDESAGVQEIARRAQVDLAAERAALQLQIEVAITAAVDAREQQLDLEIARRDEQIADLTRRLRALEGSGGETVSGDPAADDEVAALSERVDTLESESARLTSLAASLREERDSLERQRDQLVSERAALRTRFTEYAQDQEEAIRDADFVALANARDAFFLSSELDLFLPGLSELVDAYDRQVLVERETTGLDAPELSEIIGELANDEIDNDTRLLILENAIEGAREDDDPTLAEFLGLLGTMIERVDEDEE